MSDPLSDAVARLRAAGIDNPRMEARLLWEHALRSSPAEGGGGEPSAEATATADGGGGAHRRGPPPSRSARNLPRDAAEDRDVFESLLARRTAREPLAYITGHKEFWSLDFAVGPGCLIPRPDTETLIETLVRHIPDRSRPFRILDLGTGSGCLLAAALSEYPNAAGVGIDRSLEALGWARRNCDAHGLAGRTTLVESDWLDTAAEPFDVVLSNPPYIPTAEIARLEPEVARHEPHAALDGGPDGLDAYRALGARLGALLAPSGLAILEIGQGQSEDVRNLFLRTGLEVREIVPDLAQIPRAVVVKHRRRII